MRISKKKTAALIATAAAVSVLAAAAGPASARPSAEKAKTAPSSHPAATALSPDHTAGPAARTSAASQLALGRVQAKVSSYVATHGTRYTFGTYADPTTGRIVMDTNAPSSVVASLTSVAGVSRATSQKAAAGVRVQLHNEATSDTFNRRDDSPPFYGGGGLLASNALCSTGYGVTLPSGGQWMVTAGHCYAIGTRVNTESNLRYVGTVTNRSLPTLGGGPIDMELLNGQPYSGRVFTGGITSSSSIPVVSAGSAVVGYNAYCHSGRTTGEQCGHTAISTTAQVCTTTGCKSPVIAYTGGVIQQGGDSGGAFYAKNASGAWIRGHVIAGNSTTGYVEPWTQVAAHYGVSIITG
ncbi:MAG TPA: hypothetical protein VFQ11_05140 [Nocardioidaceae bacterium]|nr:hypothetical protein [Nocardioidaceae bacterium]